VRVCILTLGSRGDVQPYVALARGLSKAGYDVALCTDPSFRGFVQAHGVEWRSFDTGDPRQLIHSKEGRALVAGMATAAIAGLLVGAPSLRLRGDYLAIVTLGFNEIIRVIIENTPFLGQATGISGLPRLTTFVWVYMAVVVTIIVARRLAESTHGRAMLAIREDEIAAEAMGVDTVGYKVRAFVIASAFAGLAGGLLVHQLQLCTPRSFTFIKSIEVVAMVVLGGMGSVTGSVVAALLLSTLVEVLRGVQEYRMVVYSLLLIVLMLTRPTGIFGTREIWDLLPWLSGRRRAGAEGTAP